MAFMAYKKGRKPTYNAQYIIYMYSMYSGWKLALIVTHYKIQINIWEATQNFREFACNYMNTYFKS